jgi:hypothetical protein
MYRMIKLKSGGLSRDQTGCRVYSRQIEIKTENVIVNMTFLGGGFGRKAFLDYPHEAVMLSKAVNAPVQVVWTREDDMTQGPFRPVVSMNARVALLMKAGCLRIKPEWLRRIWISSLQMQIDHHTTAAIQKVF